MKYRVIEFFTDAQDSKHAYNVGDEYPRKGVTATPERIKELSSANNKRNKPLIEAVEKRTIFDAAPEEEEKQPKKRKRS